MKKILLIALLSFSATTLAEPAFPGEVTFTQKDGSTFKGHNRGDEWFGWIEDKQKNIIIYNENSQNHEFATFAKNNGILDLTPSGISVGSSNKLNKANNIKNVPEDLEVRKKLIQIWQQKIEAEKRSNFD